MGVHVSCAIGKGIELMLLAGRGEVAAGAEDILFIIEGLEEVRDSIIQYSD